MIATHGTAYHVETLVRKYRRARKLNDLSRVAEPMQARPLDWYHDEDGMLVLRARLPAEQGALVVATLERAMERAKSEGISADPLPPARATDVTARNAAAGTEACAQGRRTGGLAESYLSPSRARRSSAERYRIWCTCRRKR